MRNIGYKSKIALLFLGLSLTTVSCVKDLEREPISGVNSATLYKDFNNYKPALAKLYGALAVGGQGNQENGDANTDISGIDGGFSNYLRQLYTVQVLSTDEAVIGWNDGTIKDIHNMQWTAQNEFLGAIYYRIYTEIALCNDFIRNTTDERLSANGISGDNLTQAKQMRAEAKFLRAQSYYHAMDLFGNVPFVNENEPAALPSRIERAALFSYIESELKAAEAELKDARTNEYGRADKAAAWALLSRLYLNAKVYTGSERNNDVITYANKVIAAGYSLKSNYAQLFMADNNVANNEVILSVNYDGIHTKTYGGTTFMVHAAVGGNMNPSDFGINGGWGGIRTTKAFVNLFPADGSDQRGRFHTNGQNLEINDISTFTDGYAFIKYKNIKSTGGAGSDASGNFVDTDIPLYRLADIYLMYAEATLRGGNGNMATALGYINQLRARAGAAPAANITLDYILDERARELSWEFTRRTDLIRYNKFTTAAYLWPWKGGVKEGQAVGDFRNLFPIPYNDIVANSNLVQNPGY